MPGPARPEPASRCCSGPLGLLLGERGSADLLRTGAEELRVTGRFELTRPRLRHEVETVLGGHARRSGGDPRPAPEPQRPQPGLRQRSARRRRHAQAARQPSGGHPRSARERIAAPAGLSAPVARRLRQARQAARQTYLDGSRAGAGSCGRASPNCRPSRSSGSASWPCSRFERDELDAAALSSGRGRRTGPRARAPRPTPRGCRRSPRRVTPSCTRTKAPSSNGSASSATRRQTGRGSTPNWRRSCGGWKGWAPRSRTWPQTLAPAGPALGGGPRTSRRGRGTPSAPAPPGGEVPQADSTS